MIHDNNLPTEKDSEKNISVQQGSMFVGPLPPPEFLLYYKEVQSDFPERIIRYAEKDQDHRIDMEKRQMALAEKGLTYNFLLRLFVNSYIIVMYVAMLASACVGLYLGSISFAMACLSVPIANLAWTMIKSLSKNSRDQNISS